MGWRDNYWKIATIVVVFVLLINPEAMQFALFIDAIGMEMLWLLFEVQILAIGIAAYYKLVKPVAVFVEGFAAQPMVVPTLRSLRENSRSLGMLLPTAATVMNVLVVGVMIFMLWR